jgi:biopolymer transport protein ExbD
MADALNVRKTTLLVFALTACRAPDPAIRAEDAACACPSTPAAAVGVTSITIPKADDFAPPPAAAPSSPGAALPAMWMVEIDASGAVRVQGTKVALGDLQKMAAAAFAKDPELRAVVQADADAKHGVVMGAVDALKQAGISRIAFAVTH